MVEEEAEAIFGRSMCLKVQVSQERAANRGRKVSLDGDGVLVLILLPTSKVSERGGILSLKARSRSAELHGITSGD